ncbi:hypothetical protein F8M41_012714 [Gigaspora margarita]|uniref:Uncharacterized protein n=1 Tax=Gigaspora margarita TaxID=4874 RepID=A0A8H4EPB9_GIGMA|nr:hypothetical protein F8M41_012714 [Gigaspora margarita]
MDEWIEESKPKELTEIKRAEIEGTSNVGDREGIRVKLNKKEAIGHHKKSADNDNKKGIFNIGCCYQIGINDESKETPNARFYQNVSVLKKPMKIKKKGLMDC